MATNPTEWRTVLVRYITEAEMGVTLFEAEVATFLTALLREWDAHNPANHLLGACSVCKVLPGPDGLCPARRRMMGNINV